MACGTHATAQKETKRRTMCAALRFFMFRAVSVLWWALFIDGHVIDPSFDERRTIAIFQ